MGKTRGCPNRELLGFQIPTASLWVSKSPHSAWLLLLARNALRAAPGGLLHRPKLQTQAGNGRNRLHRDSSMQACCGVLRRTVAPPKVEIGGWLEHSFSTVTPYRYMQSPGSATHNHGEATAARRKPPLFCCCCAAVLKHLWYNPQERADRRRRVSRACCLQVDIYNGRGALSLRAGGFGFIRLRLMLFGAGETCLRALADGSSTTAMLPAPPLAAPPMRRRRTELQVPCAAVCASGLCLCSADVGQRSLWRSATLGTVVGSNT